MVTLVNSLKHVQLIVKIVRSFGSVRRKHLQKHGATLLTLARFNISELLKMHVTDIDF